MIKLLATPSRGVMKIVGAGFALFSKAVTTVLGGQMLQDAAQFVQLFEDMFGGFRQRAQATYELLRAAGTKFVVVSICEADSLREASYFADRLRAEHMPLAGLILNRTHPPLADLPPGRAGVGAEKLERQRAADRRGAAASTPSGSRSAPPNCTCAAGSTGCTPTCRSSRCRRCRPTPTTCPRCGRSAAG